jgi:hypothetical protein
LTGSTADWLKASSPNIAVKATAAASAALNDRVSDMKPSLPKKSDVFDFAMLAP